MLEHVTEYLLWLSNLTSNILLNLYFDCLIWLWGFLFTKFSGQQFVLCSTCGDWTLEDFKALNLSLEWLGSVCKVKWKNTRNLQRDIIYLSTQWKKAVYCECYETCHVWLTNNPSLLAGCQTLNTNQVEVFVTSEWLKGKSSAGMVEPVTPPHDSF